MPMPYEYRGSSISQEEWDKALEIANRWKEVRGDAYGAPGKALGIMGRALLHLKVCYDEQVRLHADIPESQR